MGFVGIYGLTAFARILLQFILKRATTTVFFTNFLVLKKFFDSFLFAIVPDFFRHCGKDFLPQRVFLQFLIRLTN